MPQQEYIRLMREIEGCKIAEIARRTGVSWITAKKYADRDNWSQKTGKKHHKRPIIDPFKEIIDTWLTEDQCIPAKQRHTAAAIHRRLVREFNFKGSDRTIRDYVSKRRKELKLEEAQAYQRLEHPGGEAQVDFCTIQVSKNAKLMEYKLLVASFPYSNASFVYPVPKENQECFLEGLKRLFDQMGGVPKRIWFDNLAAAVVHIEKDGQRKCTDAFLRFVAHYRFEPVFCNPASGNEKGHVENKVGYSRRNWCVPVPIFTDHETLASELVSCALADRKRKHYAKGVTIEELWQEESAKLLVLPEEPFQVFRLEQAKVNNYGEVRFDGVSFPLFEVHPEEKVILKIYWDHIEVLNQNYKLIGSFPRPYTHKTADVPWDKVIHNLKRKPRSAPYSQFVRMMPSIVQEFILLDDLEIRRNRLYWLSNWLKQYSLDEVAMVLKQEDWNQAMFSDVVTHRLYALRHPIVATDEISIPGTPTYTPDLTIYDRLHKGGRSE
ncbi:IS21 family transposase [Desulfotomaculum nigrificans]|uniref:IS21 family transposase n=1 Tax=Desulfotomaculum nigrificans TaxID=1565 RepID=UPI001F23BB3C|nr:IS21 family transposase [Desulfotomaculum nigrificans]